LAHLVYQTAFIGDLLLTTPLIRGLRQLYPEGQITLACRKGGGELFKHLGLVDEVIEVDKSNPSSQREFERQLRQQTYQTIICAHQSFRTHKLMLSLKAERKVGYSNWWNSFVFHDRVKRPMHLPEALRLMALLQPLDSAFADKFQKAIADGSQNNLKQQISLSAWPSEIPYFASMQVDLSSAAFQLKIKEILAKFKIQQPAIFVAPGSVWATKKWREEHYQDLCRLLISKGYKVYLTGSPGEKEVCERIAKGVIARDAASLSANKLVNLAGQTSIIELFYLYSQGEYLMANDSSPIHLAAMSAIPTIAIFGPTTISLGYRPWNNKARVAQIELSCRPCGAHGHNECPIGTHDCMKLLSPRQVLEMM
jgi:heptosyltransferase II